MSFQENKVIRTEDKLKEIFIPESYEDIKQIDIFRYLQNLEIEIAEGLFSQKELLLLQEALYGKYLDIKRRPFFMYHFLPLWEQAIMVLFKDTDKPKIIELGCGTGTSSLLFALLGAEVIGIELNADLVEICNKRKRFYKKYKDSIHIEFYQANTLDFHFNNHAPVDAFFSLFAFNLMKPPNILLERIVPALRQGGKISIIDGNSSSLYSKLLPSRRRPGVFNPTMMSKKLESLGCKIKLLETHCAIPSFIFKNKGLSTLALIFENMMRLIGLHKYLGISYTVVAEKV